MCYSTLVKIVLNKEEKNFSQIFRIALEQHHDALWLRDVKSKYHSLGYG